MIHHPQKIRGLSQWKRKSIDLLLCWMMVLFITPSAVKLSVWTGDGGCFRPILMIFWWTRIIYLAGIYSAPISASAADDITNLMIWAILRTAPFHLGAGVSSDKYIWSPVRIPELDSLLNPESEWSARTIDGNYLFSITKK